MMSKLLILLAMSVIAASDIGKIQDPFQFLNSLENPKQLVLYYRQDKGHAMAEVTFSYSLGVPKIEDCNLYGDNNVIDYALQDVHENRIFHVDKEEMSMIIQNCTEYASKKIQYSDDGSSGISKIKKIIINSLLIYPGTKWCGFGDIAKNYNDLGVEKEADKCCRAHDHCNDTIHSYNWKYGLWNAAIFTKSHCDCDYELSRCLRSANTFASNQVGRLYFNALQVQCFKKDYPIVKCKTYKGIANVHLSCQKYVLDETKPKIWQFFDAVFY
ncbi:phospholipase A2-like [Centruroides vittatus]|uniref:phospholipase A2-like n=1 Tax=Centruroides vittatus TaxID=120091 RepID=UPI003510D12B